MKNKKRNICILILGIVIIIMCLYLSTPSESEMELATIEEYCNEISKYQDELKKYKYNNYIDDLSQEDMTAVIIKYRLIFIQLDKLTKIYKDSEQKEIILEMIRKSISEEDFNKFLYYAYSSSDIEDISEDILTMYE